MRNVQDKISRVIVVMPAYCASATLEKTIRNLPDIGARLIVSDDASLDSTPEISKSLGIETIVHPANRGYGGNQKTLYERALAYNPEIIIMVHPDNQYDTSGIASMISIIDSKKSTFVLGSRMKTALKNGMPLWKYAGNRMLTAIQNAILKTSLSEFHSGLRAYDAKTLRKIPFQDFSDDFVFDSQMIIAWRSRGYSVSEIDTQCRYTKEASSINFARSVKYGFGTLFALWQYLFGKI